MANELKIDRDLRTDAVDFSFGEIVNLHSDSEIIISPEYQRLFRWSDEQKSRLVESILVQLPIPPIFMVENNDGVLELIDGLQRVSSVIQFIAPEAIKKDPLRLVGCDLVKELNGKLFVDLPLSDRLRIKRTPIRAIIIKKQGNPYIKYELFKRLNTGGSLLSAQEIRNCSSRMIEGGEDFYKHIQSLANYEPFKKAIGRLPDNSLSEKGDEELVLRFFAVKNFVTGYHGNVQEWLDSYMESILFRTSLFNVEEEREVFEQSFSLLADKFGEDAFARHRDESDEGIQGNPSPFSWSGLDWLWFGLEEFGPRRYGVGRSLLARLSTRVDEARRRGRIRLGSCKVAESGAQRVEITCAPLDIARLNPRSAGGA